MSEIRILVGAKESIGLQELVLQSANMQAWDPFDHRAVKFVSQFSKLLLTHSSIRNFPELAALGHWFRAARLNELANSIKKESKSSVWKGRGLAFHIAPSNVDSVSMYSWLLSFLAGNVNVVRVSQKSSDQLDFLVEVLNQALASNQVIPDGVYGRFVILTYPHDVSISSFISKACMLRVVWGGDDTVSSIRALPLRPTAVEVSFPDRFSIAAINANEVLKIDDVALNKLALNFYNDAFWFSQQACSSPRVVFWIGKNDRSIEAQNRFWSAVESVVLIKESENTPSMNMARLGAAFEMAAKSTVSLPVYQQLSAFPSRLDLNSSLDENIKLAHCGNGLFLEKRYDRLSDIASQLSDKEQTMSVFGFKREEIVDFIDHLPPRSVDRIVPVGEALGFDSIWDGINMLQLFSRQITVPLPID